MEWLPFAAGGAVALAAADVSIKLASGRISGQLVQPVRTADHDHMGDSGTCQHVDPARNRDRPG